MTKQISYKGRDFYYKTEDANNIKEDYSYASYKRKNTASITENYVYERNQRNEGVLNLGSNFENGGTWQEGFKQPSKESFLNESPDMLQNEYARFDSPNNRNDDSPTRNYPGVL
jgi:hypothetical protein